METQLIQAQKIEAIGKLAGGIAHNFNNMLTVVLGYVEILLNNQNSNYDTSEPLNEIQTAALKSKDLTSQLLAFSKNQPLEPNVLNINTIIRNTEKILHQLIGENIEFITMLNDKLGNIVADLSQIEQVIIYLAINVRDSMPNGGKLIIETNNTNLDKYFAMNHLSFSPGHYIILSITDTGHGMDKETKSKIFEPFFTTKDNNRGTGLGLSSVYGTIKQSNGYIYCYSELDKGTTFKIYLPRTDAVPISNVKEKIIQNSRNGNEHILIVEDDSTLRNLFKKMFEKLNYKITIAANGNDALLLIEKNGIKPVLILTDIVMPEISGIELVKHLQTILPDVKILFMFRYSDTGIMQDNKIDLIASFIQKPFNIHDLTTKIDELLQKN